MSDKNLEMIRELSSSKIEKGEYLYKVWQYFNTVIDEIKEGKIINKNNEIINSITDTLKTLIKTSSDESEIQNAKLLLELISLEIQELVSSGLISINDEIKGIRIRHGFLRDNFIVYRNSLVFISILRCFILISLFTGSAYLLFGAELMPIISFGLILISVYIMLDFYYVIFSTSRIKEYLKND